MPQETMTPLERWLAVLNHEVPDRIPMDYWATEEATDRLTAYLRCSTLEEALGRLHVDAPVRIGPRYAGPALPADRDIYGRGFRTVSYAGGAYRECVDSPLAAFESVAQIEAAHRWPSADSFDYSVIPGQLRGKDDRPVQGGGSEPFLIYKDLRGHEQALADLVLHPDVVHYCLDKLFDFCYQNTLRIFEQAPGRVTFSYVAEDLGSQHGLLISPAHIREFLLPRMKRMIELVHEASARVFHHDDGAVLEIIPEMIAAGIDVLNPIQWRCDGMDRAALKRRFGSQIAFHGGMDNQQTLAFGSPDDVRREVEDNIRLLGENGGYILAPCHNIQSVSPPENVVAMYDAGYKLGWYETG